VREYLLAILSAAVITYLLTPAVRIFAIWFGAAPAPRARDVHKTPIPRLGGLAMFGGMLGSLVVAARLPNLSRVFNPSLAGGTGNVSTALLLAGGLIVLLGIADDRWGVDSLTKFAGQVAAAGILIMNGVQILSIPLPSGENLALGPELGVPLTVLIVVATINAVNFIDGLDGLAAGVVGIAATALFVYSYLLAGANGLDLLTAPTLVAAILMGVCMGFLPHNFSPAKIFMGDTGSMLIGLLLSTSTIMITGQFDSQAVGTYRIFPFFVPLLLVPAVVAIPFLDMLLAVWRRTNSGRSPFAPDKEHLHHRLLDIGHSVRRAVLIMYFWVGLLASSVIEIAVASSISGPLSVSPKLALTVMLSLTALAGLLGLLVMILFPRYQRRRRRARHAARASAAPARQVIPASAPVPPNGHGFPHPPQAPQLGPLGQPNGSREKPRQPIL
jgi:UDP-GlcNAc:undecaprenyl-phosphate GlcNAc-1-phosphate transferase